MTQYLTASLTVLMEPLSGKQATSCRLFSLMLSNVRFWPTTEKKSTKTKLDSFPLSGRNRRSTYEVVFIPFRPFSEHELKHLLSGSATYPMVGSDPRRRREAKWAPRPNRGNPTGGFADPVNFWGRTKENAQVTNLKENCSEYVLIKQHQLIWINAKCFRERYKYQCVTRSPKASRTQPGDRDLGQT
jgi:hypothetical protein